MKTIDNSKSLIISISNNDIDKKLLINNLTQSFENKSNENKIKQNITIDLSGNDLENSRNKKRQLIKGEVDLKAEEDKDIIINLEKSKTPRIKKRLSLPKKRKKTILKRKRKRIIKKKKEDDEDYEIEGKKSKYFLRKNNKKDNQNKNAVLENEMPNNDYSDDEELMDFIKKKTCLKNTLLKYKDKYRKKKNNKIIFLKEEDEEEYFNKLKEENKNESELRNTSSKDSFDNEFDNKIKNKYNNKIKKVLKKDTDNKEMKLALDAECIICCGIIKELANPDGCDHNFCKSCLIEWSQRSGKCPICKNVYNNIFVYDDGVKKQLSLNEIRKKYRKEKNDENENENIEKICYKCRKNDDEQNLILCDRCRENFCHYYCCNLKKLPSSRWNCQYCIEELKEIRENKKKVVKFFL